jgi:hypothetical protein
MMVVVKEDQVDKGGIYVIVLRLLGSEIKGCRCESLKGEARNECYDG